MKFLGNIVSQLYFTTRLYIVGGIIALLFVLSFFWAPLLTVSKIILIIYAVGILGDGIMCFHSKQKFVARRDAPQILSNGYTYTIRILMRSLAFIPFRIHLIDELPYQFQIRDFGFDFLLRPGQKKILKYTVRPTERGDYGFGNIIMLISTPFALVQRRVSISAEEHLKVYPAVVEMKKYELHGNSTLSQFQGLKRQRKVGQSREFDQIKEYVVGNDYQHINWKATSRMGKLMVNHYEAEKSQMVYCLIDKSRAMKLPFNGLSLLEYAINSSLVIANTALQKQDRVGLFTFCDKVDQIIKAKRDSNQLRYLLEALYNQTTDFLEADYERLYFQVTKTVRVRSLLFLFTNFESTYALDRHLSVIRKLNKHHLLVVVFFENEELSEYAFRPAETVTHIYNATIAKKLLFEKMVIAQKLKQYGIQTIFTKPQELSINVINKYLEMKSKGLF